MTEKGELALSSCRHPCDRGHLSVGECLADARHAMSCCVTYDHPCYFWWVLCVSGAGRESSEPSKLDVAVICYTQIPFTAHKAVYTHRCIYTQAHACVHINTCLCPSGSECYNVQKVFTQSESDLLRSCCQTKTSKLKVLSPPARHACMLSLSSGVMVVSGRGLIMLSLHCAHTVLTVGWHGL